jgi:DNA polymerase-3 subunit delta
LTSFSDLRQACDSVPFLAPARLVIVTDLFTANAGKNLLNELLAYLPHLPETTRLVFMESQPLRDNHPLLRLAQQEAHGYARLFTRPEGSALEKWIKQRVEQKNGRISSQAVHMLATNIGNDLQILDNEIEKLALYKGKETIEADDVALLCPYVAEATIFDLVDALGNRNGKRAAVLLQQKFNEGTDPFYIFAMFIRQFRLLIQVKELADTGERPAGMAKQLKMHSFVAGKLYQQSQHFTLNQLEQIYRHLLEVDVAVKIGRNDMTTALHLLVAGVVQS